MYSLQGSFILQASLQSTPSALPSECCKTHRGSPLPSGSSLTTTSNLRWELCSTVSNICNLYFHSHPNAILHTTVLCCVFFMLIASVKHLIYFSLDYRGEVQELTFDQPQVHRLFYGSFHKVTSNANVVLYLFALFQMLTLLLCHVDLM